VADPRIVNVLKAFTRRLLDEGRNIESHCKYCGDVIVGSARDGLLEKEEEHFKKCPKVPRD
jgi:hypothetical protein